MEIDSQLELAIRLKLATYEDLSIIDERMNELFAKLTNLIDKTR